MIIHLIFYLQFLLKYLIGFEIKFSFKIFLFFKTGNCTPDPPINNNILLPIRSPQLSKVKLYTGAQKMGDTTFDH